MLDLIEEVSYVDYNAYMKKAIDSYLLDSRVKKPDWIIGIARGGMPLMDYATRRFKSAKYAIIPTQVYSRGLQKLRTPKLGDLTHFHPQLNFTGKVLIVDDILDTGTTLELVYKKVEANSHDAAIHVAVVMKKHGPYDTGFINEIENRLHYGKEFPKNCYIVQPFEDPKKLVRSRK